MQYKSLAILAAALCFLLALTWLCGAELLLRIWDLPYSVAAGVVSRRCAALFAGVGVMFYLARNAALSPATVALLWGLASGCALLATLGVAEFFLQHAGAGILLAASSETALALVFAWAARRDALAIKRSERA